VKSNHRHNARRFTCNPTLIEVFGLTGTRRRRSAVLVALVLTLATGCIPVPRGNNPLDLRFMSSNELRDYAEEVFREQNRLTTRLMMAPMEEGSANPRARRRIKKAESRMTKACASLNRIAMARAQGEEVDTKLEQTVRRNVRQCEHETRRLKKLLDKFEIGLSHANNGRLDY